MKEKSGSTVAAVAGGVVAAISGVAIGIVRAPVVGAAIAHGFVHEDDLDRTSDQSDDEDAVHR